MGFGYLMIGYFFVSVISLYSPVSFAMLAGYPMMIVGLWHLAHYHHHFKYCFYVSFASLPFALYYSVYAFGLMGLTVPPVFEGTSLWRVAEWLYFAFVLCFTAMILYAINSICGELGLSKWRGVALRNLILLGLTYALDLVGRLFFGLMAEWGGYLSLLVLLLRLIVIFLDLYLIWGCYRYIVPEGEETPPLQLPTKGGKDK